MTKEEIINIAWNIFPISDREKNEAFIELLVHFAQGIAEKEREEYALNQKYYDPVAFMSSTKQNQLVSKTQYDSMDEKNKLHFDIPLFTTLQQQT